MGTQQINLLISVLIALAVREIIKRRNKSKNDAFYAELGKKDPSEVVHLWLKTMARHSIPFQFTVIIEIFVSLAILITLDYFYPNLTEFTIPLSALALFLRANKAWMKVIYLRNLSPEMKDRAVEYFNENSQHALDRALQDPEIKAFFKVLPEFVGTLISKRIRAMKLIA